MVMKAESIPDLLLGRLLGTYSRLQFHRDLRAMPRRDALDMLRTILLWSRWSMWMRREAIDALLLLGGREAEKVLIEALHHAQKPSPDLFRDIVEALQAFPSEKTRKALWQVVRGGLEDNVRKEAVFSLAVLGETAVSEELKRIARNDPDEEQRRRADIALKWLEFYAGRQKLLLDMLRQNPLTTTEALLLLLKHPSSRKARSLLLLAKNHPVVKQKYGRDIDQRLCLPGNQLEH